MAEAEEEGTSSPEELSRRIQELKKPRRGDPQFARAMGLVASLGITFIGAVYGSWILGGMLDRRTGSQFYTPLALLLGVVAGGWLGYLLLRPLLRDDR